MTPLNSMGPKIRR